MRLIDADKLLATNYSDEIIKLCNPIPYIELEYLIKLIDAQPTAYDVEKVVKKLGDVAIERYENDNGMGGEMVVNLDDAIEIVKVGGVDENNRKNT